MVGAAASSTDYLSGTGTLTFQPGETSKTVSYVVNGDTDVEANEDFTINLSNPYNATILDGIGTGVILNDDGGFVGDKVWLDANSNGIQDANEGGQSGVIVNLRDGLGAFLASTTTDVAGFYFFSGLAAGSYQVEFVAAPGYAFTLQDQGSDDEQDSDADRTTGRTAFVTLGANEFRTDLDAGLFLDE